jgi:hypothetical protein
MTADDFFNSLLACMAQACENASAMLTIRSEQDATFGENATAGFVRRAVSHLRAELSDRVIDRSDDQLRAWVRDAITRADFFGLRTEKQIICFLDSEVLLGPQFYQYPHLGWAQEILSSTKLHPDDKSRLLLAAACSVYQSTNVK